MDAGGIMTRHLLRGAPLALCVVAGAALAGCHSSGATTDVDADFVSCTGEKRATPYQPGMQVTSTNGTFVVKLLSNTFTDSMGKTTDEAFEKGVDVWSVETDTASTATPTDGLAISVRPYMPDHVHGTTPVGVMPVGSGGLYTIDPVNLYMAGYWEVTLTIVQTPPAAAGDADAGADAAPPAPITDTAVLKICVPD
jgi:hypothetical protein